jgi:hypothetical protein
MCHRGRSWRAGCPEPDRTGDQSHIASFVIAAQTEKQGKGPGKTFIAGSILAVAQVRAPAVETD